MTDPATRHASGDPAAPRLSDVERAQLFRLARAALEAAVRERRAIDPARLDLSPRLLDPGASFVTLLRDGQLRGCIGTLEPYRPLAHDVAANAVAAALQDPRFPPVAPHELPALRAHLSVLSPFAPLPFEDEEDLARRLRPGVDGLILAAGDRRATFLPSVWEQLPEPRRFIAELKRKAGIGPQHDGALQAWRYVTESFGEE